MADVYGKSYFSWVQCSNPCILDPISAIITRQLALGRTKTNPKIFTHPHFSAPPRLRGESQIGGRP
jgi:hypothetical protein